MAAGCCGDTRPPVDFLTPRLGGDTTARAARGRPFNQAARNLTNADTVTFGRGAEVFDHAFGAADGLGPASNADGCLACHLDGLQHPHRQDRPPGLVVRVSIPGPGAHGGPRPEPTYGLQLQTAAVSGHPEARLDPRYVAVHHRWATGRVSTVHRIDPGVTLLDGPLAPGTMTSVRTAPEILGRGLLEAIPEQTVAAAADPSDADHDGISGRANWVWSEDAGGPALGRFGWKAGQPGVAQQTTLALVEDMGVTSGTELGASPLADLVFYNRTIAVPVAREATTRRVREGASVFVDAGCAACHTPTQRTGPSDIAALADQVFHPYTDLLVHDMGPGLADGRPEFGASGREWRTAPLWGLGRRRQVTGSPALLHDGRALSPTEAILWHDGEARTARLRFERLSDADRVALLGFLDSL